MQPFLDLFKKKHGVKYLDGNLCVNEAVPPRKRRVTSTFQISNRVFFLHYIEEIRLSRAGREGTAAGTA